MEIVVHHAQMVALTAQIVLGISSVAITANKIKLSIKIKNVVKAVRLAILR